MRGLPPRSTFQGLCSVSDRPRCTILAQESSIMTGNELANMYEFSYAAIKAQADKYVLGLKPTQLAFCSAYCRPFCCLQPGRNFPHPGVDSSYARPALP